MIKKLIRNVINKLLKIKVVKKLLGNLNESIQEEKLLKVKEPFLGFHGDQYLLNLVNFLFLEAKNFV